MDCLTGIWRLIESKAWDEKGDSLPAPYGDLPIGQITFTEELRMLAALCRGGEGLEQSADRGYSSYGGRYMLKDCVLSVIVDMASDAKRIGSQQIRETSLEGRYLSLRPPLRPYGGVLQRRELLWEQIWSPTGLDRKM